MDKPKKRSITWGEAAKIVLDNSPCPLTHKEILQVILEKNLKEVKLSGPSALACINAMLHANSRSSTDLFHKVEGRSGCYRLNENRAELKDPSANSSDSSGSSSNSVLSDTKQLTSTQFPEDNLHTVLNASSVLGVTTSNFPMPTTMSGSLPPISSMLGGLSGRVSTTTSVTSSVACAIADSRLNSLIAPSPDVPLPSALSKKRSVKPHFQGEGPTTKKPRVTFKLDKEKKGKLDRPSRPPVKTKAELKYMGDEAASAKNFIPPVLKPPMDPTHTVVKASSGAFFGQKRHKKMSIAAQVKRSKEGLVDLVSPDSILGKMNVRTLINFKTFNLLPPHHQYILLKLLPECDREVGSRGELRPSNTAFSNEFFTSAFRSWRERLCEGEFTPEMTLKIQQEQDKFLNEDPWKTKHFEPAWGEKLFGYERYVSPVEKSHQTMRNIHHEWAKELERIKMLNSRGTENEDLSAPNKMNRKHPGQETAAKNLTTKQRAAILRQQKLASAKSANKASKKSGDKASSRGNGGKNSSKDGQESAVEKAAKTGEKAKTKQTSKSSKQKANRVGKTTNSAEILGIKTIVAAEPVLDVGETAGTVLTSNMEPKLTLQTSPTAEVLFTSPPSSNTALELPLPEKTTTEKPATKTTKSQRKKVTVKSVTVVTKPQGFHCKCLLKAMVICRMCGAYCHADCISPMSVCRACTG